MPPALSSAVGYGVVVGLGFLFAFAMILTTFVLRRYNNEVQTSEMFSTAGRTVKTGLVASAVVSSWTWAATLLQSTGVTYRYGVSGSFWYSAGATVQVILFATLAIQLKRRAPNAHTFLEVIRARYGTITHGVFITFALMTNILVTAQLLTGGAAVVTFLTGVPTVAAIFLLPIGVVMYTMFGGIKATFLTDYVHTVVIIVVILIFAITTYGTGSVLGSPGRVWELLQEASIAHPVEGNAQGSYLTMQSREGGIFFVINIVGNFGTVFMDNGYYNKAIAASPVHALPGYIMGGLAWFAIPWLCATSMGLAALALESNPIFPTYPNRIADADVTAGLVLPEAATAVLGKGGAAATLLLVFMAVTSAMSAELIAVSSIFTYDIYQTYINPGASGRRLIYTSHSMVIFYAVCLAAFSTGLFYIGISLGYLYLLMGVIISSAVLPSALTLLWSGQSRLAAMLSPPLGLACSLTAWLVTAHKLSGSLSVESTGANYPMLAGNVVALLSPIIFVPVITLLTGPQRYDWESMRLIRRTDDSDVAADAGADPEKVPGSAINGLSAAEEAEEMRRLDRAAKISRWLTLFLAVSFLVLWPMPMYGSGYIFSRRFFTGWVVVAIIWLFISAGCVGIYPVWEGRHTISAMFRAIARDLGGHGRVTTPAVAVQKGGGAGGGEESRSGSEIDEIEVQDFQEKADGAKAKQ